MQRSNGSQGTGAGPRHAAGVGSMHWPPQPLQLQLPLELPEGAVLQRGQPLWVRVSDAWVLPAI
jgi:hypothetical protein